MSQKDYLEERQYTVLMIEDDPGVMELNRKSLARRGMETLAADTLEKARMLLHEGYDAIILDIHLPDGSGLDFIPEIRFATAAPILILTGKKEDADIVAGLLSGGDDYLTKPYRIEELHARIVALLRRVEMAQSRSLEPRSFGRVTMDSSSARAYWDEEDMLLKPKEYNLLWEFISRRGEYLSSEALYEKLWGAPAIGNDQTVRNHIYSLRKKLETVGAQITIEQERNKGYRLILE